jgi:hypothetical protein
MRQKSEIHSAMSAVVFVKTRAKTKSVTLFVTFGGLHVFILLYINMLQDYSNPAIGTN